MKADDINFLPASYRERQRRQRHRVRVLVGSMLFTACLFAWAISQRSAIDEMRRYARSAEAEVAEAQQQATVRGKLRAQFLELSRQDGVQSQLAQPVQPTQVLAVLGEILPAGVGLLELEIEAVRPAPPAHDDKAKPAATSATASTKTPPREHLKIRFEAIAPDDTDVNDTIAQMTEHPLFEQVALAFSREDDRLGIIGRRFALDARIDLEKRYLDASPQATPQEVAHVR